MPRPPIRTIHTWHLGACSLHLLIGSTTLVLQILQILLPNLYSLSYLVPFLLVLPCAYLYLTSELPTISLLSALISKLCDQLLLIPFRNLMVLLRVHLASATSTFALPLVTNCHSETYSSSCRVTLVLSLSQHSHAMGITLLGCNTGMGIPVVIVSRV